MNQSPYPSPDTTVVVVDDDPGFCKTLSDILQTRGLHVVPFSDPQRAIDFVQSQPPAVMLLDLRLPHISGLKLLEIIKKTSPDTECILLTGYASQESAIAAVNLGAFSYLQKPYDLDQLILTIQQAATKHQSVISLRQRTTDLTLINRLHYEANRGASIPDLIDILSDTVEQHFHVFITTLYLIDADGSHLEMVQTSLKDSVLDKIRKLLRIEIPPIRLPLAKLNVIPDLLQAGAPTLLREPERIEAWIGDFVETETLPEGLRPRIRKAIPQIARILQLEDVLFIPLVVGERPIGLLDFSTQIPLSPSDIERLSGFSEQLIAILQRKQAEEALERISSQNELILNTMAEGIMGLDLMGRHTFVNPTAARLLGYLPEELLGKEGHQRWHHHAGGSSFAEEDCPISQTLEKGLVHSVSDDLFWRKDGAALPVEYTSAPLLDSGEIVGVVVAFRDISERKAAEQRLQDLLQQLQQQKQQLSEVMDSVPEGVVFLDNNHDVVLANRVAKQELAMLAGARVGSRLHFLGNRPLNELLTSPRQKGRWHEVEHDGSIFEVIARPISSGAQQQGWVMVINDVTQQRALQEQSYQQERLAAIGQLAAGIAHDFNNILAVIVLYAKLGLRPADTPPMVADYLRTILDQTERASNLIQQVLDFSRRSVMERQAIDLNRFLNSQVELLRRTLPESVEIQWSPREQQAMANIDTTRLQQAILNIATNARDVMLEGGTLTIEVGETRIERAEDCPICGKSMQGSWYTISFRDTGPGIPADILPHIFEPFFTTKESRQGTGLGLAQVFGILQQHEGHVHVESEPGQGATFTFFLPPVAVAVEPLAELTDNVLVTGNGETILVVEDDAMVLQALTLTLQDLNYRVVAATNGREALEKLRHQGDKIMLVISDMVMPVMGGKALFYAMKEHNYRLPMIIITGHPMEEELDKLRQQGLDDWMLKPPDPVTLSQKIANLIRKPRHN